MLFPVQHENINSGSVKNPQCSRWIVHILHKTKCANLNQNLIFSPPLATTFSNSLLHQRWRREHKGHPGALAPGTTDIYCVIFQTVSRWLCEVGSHTDEPAANGLQLPRTHNSCEPDAGQNLGPFKWKPLELPSQRGQKSVRFTPRRVSCLSSFQWAW